MKQLVSDGKCVIGYLDTLPDFDTILNFIDAVNVSTTVLSQQAKAIDGHLTPLSASVSAIDGHVTSLLASFTALTPALNAAENAANDVKTSLTPLAVRHQLVVIATIHILIAASS